MIFLILPPNPLPCNPFTSNPPAAAVQGHETGTETENNARVIHENRFGMAAVGDESGECPTDFPNSTFVPPTTTQSAVVLKCKIRGMAYTGDRLKFKWAKARNARACEKRYNIEYVGKYLQLLG